MPSTSIVGIPYAGGGDPPNGPADEQALAQRIEDIVIGHTYAEINAFSGIDLWTGRRVYQTNTGAARPFAGVYEYNGVDWRLPWNMEWGELDYAEHGAAQGINTSTDDIVGCIVTANLVANRKIEVRGSVGFVGQNTSAGVVKVYITDGANAGLGLVVNENLAAGERTAGERGFRLVSLSGSVTFKLRAVTSLATMTVNSGDSGPAWIGLYDRGPNGLPA